MNTMSSFKLFHGLFKSYIHDRDKLVLRDYQETKESKNIPP